MGKKVFISIILIMTIVFSCTICFATGNVANDVKNVVSGVGNAVEDTAKGAVDVTKDAVGGTVNATKNAANGMTGNNNRKTNMGTTTMTNNNNYTARRVATGNTVLGMTSTGWKWMIVAAVGVAIIALIWYYIVQEAEVSRDYNDRND